MRAPHCYLSLQYPRQEKLFQETAYTLYVALFSTEDRLSRELGFSTTLLDSSRGGIFCAPAPCVGNLIAAPWFRTAPRRGNKCVASCFDIRVVVRVSNVNQIGEHRSERGTCLHAKQIKSFQHPSCGQLLM